MDEYLTILEPLRYRAVRVLEIGIFRGGSLLFWSDYFKHPDAQVIGLDISLPSLAFPANVTVYQCDQNDVSGLERIAGVHGPFDLIIDDGSHRRRETETCFNVLFDRLTPGGYYSIEDWAAGYWEHAPEYSGMVQLVTELIERAPKRNIDSFKVILNTNKAMALFRRGLEGWTS